MPLVSMTTNLKSLRFGNDTVGGGNSNQPYIVTPIPEKFSDIGRTGGPDFLLRGGTLLPKVTVQDTSRLFKMFFDFRSPAGPLFVVKQNVLSLSNVNSSAGYVSWSAYNRNKTGNFFQRVGSSISTFVRNNVAINQGIYTPLSTLGQAAGNSLGVHLNKQGINPFKGTTQGSVNGNSPLGLPTYLNVIASQGNEGKNSRLLSLTNKIDTKTTGNNLYTYLGGPGAILGVGKTTINMVSDQRTGINNVNSTYFLEKQSSTATLVSKNKIFVGKDGFTYAPAGISFISPQLPYKYLDPRVAYEFFREDYIDFSSPSVYQSGTLLETNIPKLSSGVGALVPIQTFTQAQINDYVPAGKSDLTFKDSFTDLVSPTGSQYFPQSLSYKNQNIETRVSLGGPLKGGPGMRGNLSSYSIGKREFNANGQPALSGSIEANSGYTKALDQVNAFPLYQTTSLPPKETNDLVKFRIGVIDNDSPNKKTYVHFRAFIDNFSDQYTSDWDSQKYMGRGEKFYKYNGFDRQISLSWTVAAQSKQELIPMYQKLNYLASVCAPDYSPGGYMRGNLISLTVGGWCYEQVGIMKGLTLEVPDDSPWEIGISDGVTMGENFQSLSSDASVKELPMVVKVTGFTFIPIHDFVPQKQQNKYAGVGATTVYSFKQNKKIVNGRFVSQYGKEQYIGLAAAGNNNYDGGAGNLNYIP